MARASLTISEVHRRTGIPVTTLRFYEKELPDFFSVEKTAGGHRRYTDESVRQFQMVRKMVETDGIRLGQLREKLAKKVDVSEIREHVDLLLSVYETLTVQIDRLQKRTESLERELSTLRKKSTVAETKKKRWF